MLKDKIFKSLESGVEKQASESTGGDHLKQAAVNALINENGYDFDKAVETVNDFSAQVEKQAKQTLGKSVDDTAHTLFGAGLGGYAGGVAGRAVGALSAAKRTGNAVAIAKGLNRGGKIGQIAGTIVGGVAATHSRENNK